MLQAEGSTKFLFPAVTECQPVTCPKKSSIYPWLLICALVTFPLDCGNELYVRLPLKLLMQTTAGRIVPGVLNVFCQLSMSFSTITLRKIKDELKLNSTLDELKFNSS